MRKISGAVISSLVALKLAPAAVVQYGVVKVAPELLRPDLCSLPIPLDAVLPRRPDTEGGLGKVGAPYCLGQPLIPRRVHPEGVAYGDGVGGHEELARHLRVGVH